MTLAFLFNPITNEFFTAQKGGGAYLNDEKIFVKNIDDFSKASIAFGISLGMVPVLYPTVMKRTEIFLKGSGTIRSFGSAALELGYLAKGSIDTGIFEYLKPWDVAAGVLIVQEAGGVVVNINDGEDFNFMKPNFVAATNLKIANEVKRIINEIKVELMADGKSPEQLWKKQNEDKEKL